MNLRPLLESLDLQEDAARALADDLRAQIDDLQTRLRKAETHLEQLTITARPSPASLTGSPHPHPNCPATRTTRASSPPSTRRPAPCEPRTSASSSAMNRCRSTSKAPGPS